MKTFECKTCGRSFDSRKATKNYAPKFCFKDCFAESRRMHKPCKLCGEEIQNPHSVSLRHRVYCSRRCQANAARGISLSEEHRKALSEGRKQSPKCKGPNLYNWKGGQATEAKRQSARNKQRHYRKKAGGPLDELYLKVLMYLQQGRCFYCECELQGGRQTHIEHLQPISKGGTNEWHNLVYSCQSCNNQKKDKPLPDFAIARHRPDWINKSFICYAAYEIAERLRPFQCQK